MAGAGAAVASQTSDSNRQSHAASHPRHWWYLFFFVSGFPALLYQIVWQRALFTLYGVNIESVTMVVTAFMVGLGLGSLLGGVVSRRQDWPLLGVFGIVELLIGLYGCLSLRVFHWAANFTAGVPPLETGLIAFLLVALPTMLMGATLPILVSYTVRLSHNVGTSIGALYAANTAGSAAACFCAGMFVMRWLGESRTLAVAAGLNAIVGASVLAWQFARKNAASPAQTEETTQSTQQAALSFPAAAILGAAAGFIALGYEIVWYRLFSFTTGGVANSFAFLLGAYLLGIAYGSQITNRFCRKITNPQSFIRFLVVTVFAANLLGFFVAPILFELAVRTSYLWALVPICIAAACLGAIFPMLCHASIPPDGNAGARTSYLYLSNIIGSALGSYLTGFVLMDLFPLRSVNVMLTLLGIGTGVALLLTAKLPRRSFLVSIAGVLVAALVVVQGSDTLFHHMYEKMQLKDKYQPAAEFASIVENRSGVIAVTQGGAVFGGGIYDGRFSVNLVGDSNGIERAFALSYVHPNPRDVLMIGLSSGSWAQVIANHPQVEHLTIVEINPGYLGLIRRRPEVASLLANPKVHIEIDDGRRWLIRNPDQKFDAVVMNTTFNWRSHVSNLLSVEFLELIRQHLKPGGVHLYNTTGSPEVLATGLRVFPYGMRLANFAVVSDSPLHLDAQRWRDVLENYKIDETPVFDLSRPADSQRLNEVLSLPATLDRDLPNFFTLESAAHIRARTAQVRSVTDDNMGTEWSGQASE
ncbi:MAG TPA: fused MFS/spermidine synthase [Candidatus Solibacter sp.]|nr:fused MFS/spermidine synthase [Candidatus Solibacter sp.]